MRTHYAAEVTPELDGKDVTVAGWVHETRDMGKLKFVIVRDRSGLVQITAKPGKVPDELIAKLKFVKETVVQFKGKVQASPPSPGGREIIPTEVNVLANVTQAIPFELTGKVPAEIDVRLDNRHVDLRRIETQAIFKIRSAMQGAFRNHLVSKGYQEIVTPCIAAAATEGGTNLFPIIYFEKEAFLVQSPQLYKQLAVIGGMDKVMMTMPVFRAEPHHTTAHINEIYQMDAEIGFADHFDAMDVLGTTFTAMLKAASEEKDAAKTLGCEVKVPEQVKQHNYTDLVNKLKDNGVQIEWGEDFSREHERKICELLGEETFIVFGYPTKVRAFYSMPDPENPEVCNAYDLMHKGLEIASGAQRIHIPELLEKALTTRGMNPANFEFYIRAFRMGAPPHAGWSIGLDRATMKVTNRENIREAVLFPRDRHRITP